MIREMQEEDLKEVMEIEKLSFPSPWTERIFRLELHKKNFAFYRVIEKEGRLIGYGGWWKIKDEAHLVKLAIHPAFRRQSYGERLLKGLLKEAKEKGARLLTLEVRESNLPAHRLYEKLGFKLISIRPTYYQDTLEDGFVYIKEL